MAAGQAAASFGVSIGPVVTATTVGRPGLAPDEGLGADAAAAGWSFARSIRNSTKPSAGSSAKGASARADQLLVKASAQAKPRPGVSSWEASPRALASRADTRSSAAGTPASSRLRR